MFKSVNINFIFLYIELGSNPKVFIENFATIFDNSFFNISTKTLSSIPKF